VPLNRAASVAILPLALFVERLSLGARWCSRFGGCCYLSIDFCFVLFERSWARSWSQSPGLGGQARLTGKTRQAAALIARLISLSGSYTSPPRSSWIARTKKSCNQGACGACTVLVEGERINSCLALAVQHQGRKIITARGA